MGERSCINVKTLKHIVSWFFLSDWNDVDYVPESVLFYFKVKMADKFFDYLGNIAGVDVLHDLSKFI